MAEFPSSSLGDLSSGVVVANCRSTPFKATGINTIVDPGSVGVGSKLALHCSGSHVAYVPGIDLSKPDVPLNSEESWNVRKAVVCRTADLVKGGGSLWVCKMLGAVQDLDFAHIFDDVVLGAVDLFGNVQVCRIASGSKVEAILDVPAADFANPSPYQLIRWCPYVEGDDGCGSSWILDSSRKKWVWKATFLIARGASVKVFNFNIPSSFTSEHWTQHDLGAAPIVDVSLSPDGESFVTLDKSGTVRFYELATSVALGCPPKLLHSIESSVGGSSHSFLAFMDNTAAGMVSDEQVFWKRLVVGNNGVLTVLDPSLGWKTVQEVDVWSAMKATKDPSGRYLLMSSADSSSAWMLEFNQDKGIVAAREVWFAHDDVENHSKDVTHYAAFVRSCENFGAEMVRLGSRSLDVCTVEAEKQTQPGWEPSKPTSAKVVKDENEVDGDSAGPRHPKPGWKWPDGCIEASDEHSRWDDVNGRSDELNEAWCDGSDASDVSTKARCGEFDASDELNKARRDGFDASNQFNKAWRCESDASDVLNKAWCEESDESWGVDEMAKKGDDWPAGGTRQTWEETNVNGLRPKPCRKTGGNCERKHERRVTFGMEAGTRVQENVSEYPDEKDALEERLDKKLQRLLKALNDGLEQGLRELRRESSVAAWRLESKFKCQIMNQFEPSRSK